MSESTKFALWLIYLQIAMLDLGIELLIAGAVYLLQLVGERMNVWMDRRSRLNQEAGADQKEEEVVQESEQVDLRQDDYIKRLEQMSVKYRPEKLDVELALKCKEYLFGIFPNGISEKVQYMSKEELLNLFRQIEKDAEEIMDVSIDVLDFYPGNESPDSRICGYYQNADKSIHLNAAFILSGNPQLVEEMVFIVFHELKHARQWAAMEGYVNKTKDYGYSEKQIKIWLENADNYIPSHVCDELYRKQPLENDAYGFASVVSGMRKFEVI